MCYFSRFLNKLIFIILCMSYNLPYRIFHSAVGIRMKESFGDSILYDEDILCNTQYCPTCVSALNRRYLHTNYIIQTGRFWATLSRWNESAARGFPNAHRLLMTMLIFSREVRINDASRIVCIYRWVVAQLLFDGKISRELHKSVAKKSTK